MPRNDVNSRKLLIQAYIVPTLNKIGRNSPQLYQNKPQLYRNFLLIGELRYRNFFNKYRNYIVPLIIRETTNIMQNYN